MKTFDIGNMDALGYDQRSRNVFHQTPEFKMRVIDLPPGGNIPLCEMASHVADQGLRSGKFTSTPTTCGPWNAELASWLLSTITTTSASKRPNFRT